ncbi:hypothetical protein JT359_18135 [Candidatus Poribacteria bacterium]|nr:hypothetical protein [Candidatus Poribacteria bacterium]
MKKSIGVILIFVLMISIVSFFIFTKKGRLPSELVEIQANPGTKVFAKLTGDKEQFLNSISKLNDDQIEVNVPVEVDIILRYENYEKIITNKEWQKNKVISIDFNELVSAQINANPWAYVFIKLPGSDDFMRPRIGDFIIPPEPNEQNTNVTPIRGGLKVPIGTTFKLVYQDKEKVFSYEKWKKAKEISHEFSNP